MNRQILGQIVLVQMYIGVMKGIEVDIAINNVRDLQLLNHAATVANSYFLSEGAKITEAND